MKNEKTQKKQPSILFITLITVVFMLAGAFVMAKQSVSFSAQATINKAPKEVIFKNQNELFSLDFKGNISNYRAPENKKETQNHTLTFGRFVMTEKDGDLFFTRKNKSLYKIDIENIDTKSLALSADEKCFMAIGAKTLYKINIKNDDIVSITPIDENVDFAAFTGGGSDIAYIKDKDFYYTSGGYKDKLDEDVSCIEPAHDGMAVFYIKKGDVLKFHVGKNEKDKVYASNVSDMAYIGEDSFAYIKNSKLFIYRDGKSIDLQVDADSFIKTGEK